MLSITRPRTFDARPLHSGKCPDPAEATHCVQCSWALRRTLGQESFAITIDLCCVLSYRVQREVFGVSTADCQWGLTGVNQPVGSSQTHHGSSGPLRQWHSIESQIRLRDHTIESMSFMKFASEETTIKTCSQAAAGRSGLSVLPEKAELPQGFSNHVNDALQPSGHPSNNHVVAVMV